MTIATRGYALLAMFLAGPACAGGNAERSPDRQGEGGRGAGGNAGTEGEPDVKGGVSGSTPEPTPTGGTVAMTGGESAGGSGGTIASGGQGGRQTGGTTTPSTSPLRLTDPGPSPVTVPIATQMQHIQSLASRVCRMTVTYDANNNVVALNFSNHKSICDTPGLSDSDLDLLVNFPALKRVRFETMGALTSQGYARLSKTPELQAALFAYPNGADRTFMLAVQNHPKLRLLELKHMFSFPGTSLEQLPTYPDLRMLELDNGSADRRVAVPFILKHPQLLSLQIHRTNMTNDDVGLLAAGLPHLESIELKPSATLMNSGVFVHVGKFKNLRNLMLAGGLTVPGWEAGGKYLEACSKLVIIRGEVAADTASRLKAALPGLKIVPGDTNLSPEQQRLQSKDNEDFTRDVIPWFVTGRKEQYNFGKKVTPVESEDRG